MYQLSFLDHANTYLPSTMHIIVKINMLHASETNNCLCSFTHSLLACTTISA